MWLIGCQSVGPSAIRVGRAKYNDAIQQTDKQQMLLNIVRLRYADVPYFLEVSSVIAAPVFEASGVFDTSFGPDSLDAYDLGGGIKYAETPVIVYAPLGGETFARRLLTPLDLDTIALLHNAGWDSERVFRLCVQSINGVRNAESAAGPTPRRPPKYEGFRRIAATVERLSEEGDFMVDDALMDAQGIRAGRFSIRESVRDRPDVLQFFEDLNLDHDAESFRLVSAVSGGGDTLAMKTRPLLGVMYFASQGVQVPPHHANDGWVAQTRTEDGEIFDWNEVMDGLMQIKYSRVPPLQSFVSVRYRDVWFYIDDADRDSKETFSLLHLLFTIQAGEKPTTSPLLSLPIGG